MLCHSSPRQHLFDLSLGAKFEVDCIGCLQYDSPVVFSFILLGIGREQLCGDARVWCWLSLAFMSDLYQHL